MRILKTMSLCVMAVCAIAALVGPANASASAWTQNGSPTSNFQQPYWSSGGTAGLSGSFNFSGGANCSTVNGSVDFANNEVKEFGIPAAGCKTVGTLKSLGCTSVKSITSKVQPLFTPVIAENAPATSRYVNFGVQLDYLFEGGAFCPKAVSISGIAKGTPDNFSSIGSVTLSGNLSSSVAGVSSVVAGTLNLASPIAIKGTTQVDLSGNLSVGHASCNVNGGLGFGANGTGSLESLNWSSCMGAGNFAGCAVTVATNGLPTAVQDEGTSIKAAGFSVTITPSACGGKPPLKLSGVATLTPDKATQISVTTASGTLSNGSMSGTLSGSLNWSPAGVYGL